MSTRDTLLAARQNAQNSIEYYENAIREREEAGAVSNNPWALASGNQDLEREIRQRRRRIAEIDRQLANLDQPNTLQETAPSYGASRTAAVERSQSLQDSIDQQREDNEQIVREIEQSNEFAEQDAEPVLLPEDVADPDDATARIVTIDGDDILVGASQPEEDFVGPPRPGGPQQIGASDPLLQSPVPQSENLEDLFERTQQEQESLNQLLESRNTVQAARAERAGRNPSDTDWRVKLSIAPGANYLYKAPDPGILAPLQATNGVIFPYTPAIDTIYYANYNTEDLTHSNYRAYFYQNSYPGEILMQATFTAQTSEEADYLLAVIHFFRSATKMFYGQDDQRGTPPPVLYLDGLGEYQFNLHPCVISQFNYNLPDDVDYIRAAAPSRFNQPQSNDPAQDVSFWAKTAASLLDQFDGTAARLAASALVPGAPAETLSTSPSEISDFVARNRISSTFQRPTYVPTELSISLTLLPLQNRKQVSEEFSLRDFASGKLLKRGFW